MSGSSVPQAVRTHVRGTRHCRDRIVHDSSDDSLIDPSTARPQEQRGRRLRTDECWASLVEPAKQRLLSGPPIRDDTFFSALAEYPDETSLLIEITKIEATELGNPDPGRIQQFDRSVVTQRDRISLLGTALGRVQRGGGLFRVQYCR
jgi:hypothetical protein